MYVVKPWSFGLGFLCFQARAFNSRVHASRMRIGARGSSRGGVYASSSLPSKKIKALGLAGLHRQG